MSTTENTSARPTLIVTCLATAMLMLDIAVVNTAIPHIGADLHAGLGGLKWIVDAYTLALATTVLTVGSLADRFGRRAVFGGGLIVFTAASLACAAAGSEAALIAARVVQGIGGSALFATSLALLARAFPGARERAGAMAAHGATIGGAFALGPLVGGALTSGLSWRWIFLVNLPIGVGALTVAMRRVEESRDPAARRIDLPGQATLTAGMFLLVLGLLRANDQHWGSTRTIAELTAGVVFLGAFVTIEARSREPMLPLSLFGVRAFAGAQVSAFAISAAFFALYLYATLYLQGVLGLSAIGAGLTLLPGTVTMFFVSGASAQLGRRVPHGAMIAGGLALVAAGLALMMTAGPNSSWLAIEPGVMLASIGTGLFNPALSAVALGSAPAVMSGLAAGINDTARQAGVAVGIAALGALIPAHAVYLHSASYVHGLRGALIVGAGLAAVGALAAWRLIGSRRDILGSTDQGVLAEAL